MWEWQDKGERWFVGWSDSHAKPPRCRAVRPSRTPMDALATGAKIVANGCWVKPRMAAPNGKYLLCWFWVYWPRGWGLGAGASMLSTKETVLLRLMGGDMLGRGTARRTPRKELRKGFAWHNPKWPFRKMLERRALPPRLRDRTSPRAWSQSWQTSSTCLR